MCKRAALWFGLIALPVGAATAATLRGSGDPTTVLATGLGQPCRVATGSDGDLYVNDLDTRTIYRVDMTGAATVFAVVPDGRGHDFDAFGNLLVPSPADRAVYGVSPDGVVTEFFSVFNARRVRTGPDGSIWIAAIDSIHHFDPMGRFLESFDVASQGGAAFGLRFSPSGELYFTSWADYWKLVDGTVVSVLTGLQPRAGAPNFDMQGNAYTIHESVGQGDTHRVILYDSEFNVVDDAWATDFASPCGGIAFGRDPDGSTNNRLFIGQRDGSIVEVKSDAISVGGFPTVGLYFSDIGDERPPGTLVGAAEALSDDEESFLDAIGNDNGQYDVGDLRAYLIRTGTIQGSVIPMGRARQVGSGSSEAR